MITQSRRAAEDDSGPPCGSAALRDYLLSEAEERSAFVAEAKTWLRTPFRDQGDVKGGNGAVDCAMLLVRSAVDTGLVAPFDPRPYPPQWLLHRDEERFLGVIADVLRRRGCGCEIPNPAGLPAEALAKAGDVIVYKVARCFAHGAIVVENGHIVHAYYKTKHVELSALTETELAFLPGGKPRPFKLFDLWRNR